MKSNQQYFYLNSNSENIVHLARGIAAQAVVIGHGASFFGVFPYIQPPHFFYIQNIGVLLFFFISGFVISYTCYIKNIFHNYTFAHFLFDRTFRLLLVFAPVALIILGVDTYFCNVRNIEYEYRNSLSFLSYLGNILFLQDYPVLKIFPHISLTSLPVTMLGTGRPFWTLAIEFWLYIFYGYSVLTKNNSLLLKVVFFLFFIVSMPVVVLNCVGGKGNGLALLWFYGVLAMYFLRVCKEMSIRQWSLIVAISFALLGAFWVSGQNYKEYNFHVSVLFCTALFLLIVFFHNLNYSIFNHRSQTVIKFLASYSFTLYASHYTVLYWLEKTLGKTCEKTLLFTAGFLLTNVIAVVLAYFFEMKYKDLRTRAKNVMSYLLIKYQ